MPYRPHMRPNLAKIIKNSPKSSISALAGDPAAVTSVINQFMFINSTDKWQRVRLWRLKMGFLDHKVPPWPQKRSNLQKKPTVIAKETSFSALARNSPDVIHHKVAPWLQKQKNAKNSPKKVFLLCLGAQQLLLSQWSLGNILEAQYMFQWPNWAKKCQKQLKKLLVALMGPPTAAARLPLS